MKWTLKIVACFAILILSYGIANDSPNHAWLIAFISGASLMFTLHLVDRIYE